MFWYIFIFMFCIVFWVFSDKVKSKNIKTMIEIIILCILILFSGTRFRLGGYDYNVYESMFYNTNTLSNFDLSFVYGTDILYKLFNSIIRTMGFDFYGFTLIESIVFYILLYRGLKKNKINFGFFIIIFLYKLFIFNTFVSMRQSLVLVIFLNLIPLIGEKKRLKYLLIILPCIFIHSSALILIPLCFIDKIKMSKKFIYMYSIVFLFLFVLNYFGIYIFNPSFLINNFFNDNISMINRNSIYFSSEISINILSTFETYIIFIIIMIFYNKIDFQNNIKENVMLNIFLLLIPIVTFFRSFEIMIRFRDYFSLSIPFVLYYVYLKLEKSKNKLLFILVIIIYCFIGYYRYIYMYGDLVPYHSYLFN